MDVFCDLMYGSGWMEIEREEVDRECNWAVEIVRETPKKRVRFSGIKGQAAHERYTKMTYDTTDKDGSIPIRRYQHPHSMHLHPPKRPSFLPLSLHRSLLS